MTDAEILAAAAVFAGGACHAATGFGFALVAAPLVAAALPPEEAITTLLLLGILTSALTLWTEGRRPRPLWGDAAALLAWGTAGAITGALVLAELSATALQLLVTLTVLTALVTSQTLRKGSDPFRRVEGSGLLAGVLTTTTSANGPPLILHLLAREVVAPRMRDTLSVLFVGFGAIGVAAIAVGAGGLALPGLPLPLVLPALAAAGHVAGRPVFARLAEGHYERVVTALLVISVTSGAIVALT